jgi:hypothetical protein
MEGLFRAVQMYPTAFGRDFFLPSPLRQMVDAVLFSSDPEPLELDGPPAHWDAALPADLNSSSPRVKAA